MLKTSKNRENGAGPNTKKEGLFLLMVTGQKVPKRPKSAKNKAFGR